MYYPKKSLNVMLIYQRSFWPKWFIDLNDPTCYKYTFQRPQAQNWGFQFSILVLNSNKGSVCLTHLVKFFKLLDPNSSNASSKKWFCWLSSLKPYIAVNYSIWSIFQSYISIQLFYTRWWYFGKLWFGDLR